jgi:DNA-binding NtrC family response regulator
MNNNNDLNISVLLVDDDQRILDVFSKLIQSKGYQPFTAINGPKALDILHNKKIDVLIADMKMPEMNGIQLLKEVKKYYPEVKVIIITGFGTVTSAVKAMKLGASDYILKPFSPDELILRIKDIVNKKKHNEKDDEIDNKLEIPKVIARTDVMKKLLKMVDTVSPTDATVLIIGETGVGKDIIARLIHQKSKRSNKSFVRMNCAELNEGVIESELFGHEKGSFTGAVTKKIGRLELANHGTLFLDEVGDIPISTQKKLLRVLEQKEFERVGGTKTICIDVRIIAATNKILLREVKRKKFRKDLFYRLNTVQLKIPPLRKRKQDIIPLAEHFMKKSKNGKGETRLTDNIEQELIKYNWPGNVRELKSSVERSIIFSNNGKLNFENIFEEYDYSDRFDTIFILESPSLKLDDVEKTLLIKVLKNSNWNIQQSAKVLEISRTTLYEKIKKYKLDPETVNIISSTSQRY